MQYAIELFFDKEMEQDLFDLAQLVADQKLSTKYLEWKTRPHVTLACFEDVDEERCISQLNDFAQSHRQLPAHIGSVGMFTDTKVIFASPVMNDSMFSLQRELFGHMSEFDSSKYVWYHPDRWVPHCGLALMSEDGDEAFFQACDLILRSFRKLNGTFESIGLVRISFPVNEIFTVGLGSCDD